MYMYIYIYILNPRKSGLWPLFPAYVRSASNPAYTGVCLQ